MDDEMITIPENDDEELLKIYDHSGRKRTDDAAAMQAAVCIILAALFFAAGYAFPELAADLLRKIDELSQSQKELFPNPISLIEGII